jgi:hypothetical protein
MTGIRPESAAGEKPRDRIGRAQKSRGEISAERPRMITKCCSICARAGFERLFACPLLLRKCPGINEASEAS